LWLGHLKRFWPHVRSVQNSGREGKSVSMELTYIGFQKSFEHGLSHLSLYALTAK